MKQILLRMPAVFAEIRFRKLTQPLCRHLLSTREILLPQHPLNPHIDREGPQPLVRKEHDAICDLRAHSWQRAELFLKLGISKRRPRLEIRFARGHESRRRAQVFGTIAEFAFAQFPLGSSCKSRCRREGVNPAIADLPLLPKSFSQRERNLADMGNL